MCKKTTFFRLLSLKPVWASRKISKVLKKLYRLLVSLDLSKGFKKLPHIFFVTWYHLSFVFKFLAVARKFLEQKLDTTGSIMKFDKKIR